MTEKRTTIEIQLQPGAKSTGIAGFKEGVLYVKVTASPQKGAANRALLRLIARRLEAPKSSLDIIRGYTSRHKVVAIRGLSAEELHERLARALPGKEQLQGCQRF